MAPSNNNPFFFAAHHQHPPPFARKRENEGSVDDPMQVSPPRKRPCLSANTATASSAVDNTQPTTPPQSTTISHPTTKDNSSPNPCWWKPTQQRTKGPPSPRKRSHHNDNHNATCFICQGPLRSEPLDAAATPQQPSSVSPRNTLYHYFRSTKRGANKSPADEEEMTVLWTPPSHAAPMNTPTPPSTAARHRPTDTPPVSSCQFCRHALCSQCTLECVECHDVFCTLCCRRTDQLAHNFPGEDGHVCYSCVPQSWDQTTTSPRALGNEADTSRMSLDDDDL